MFKDSPAGRSPVRLPDLDLIASQTKLVIRKSRKFSPTGFLQTLLSSVATGLGSLNQLAGSLKDFTVAPMARQSLHERFNARSTAFLIAVLSDLMEQRFQPAAAVLGTGLIQRILIEDASAQVMPKANSATFRAHGNHHGATAGVKIDLAFDLLTGTMVSHGLHAATEQDKSIGQDFVASVQTGDLVLRDMGYFALAEFTAIEARGGFWLTRLPLTTGVVLDGASPLEKYLKRCRRDVLDMGAIVGEEGKQCRLVAVRATPEVTNARRAQRRKKARACGKQACPKGLERDGWHIMLTNLCIDAVSVSQLAAVYRARWAVEIQFRAWKQALNLGKALNRRGNLHHMQALVLAAMIVHQLGMKVAARLRAQVGRAAMSYEKLYDLLAVHLIKARDLAELCAFIPEFRHIKRDKRNRQSPVESGISALA